MLDLLARLINKSLVKVDEQGEESRYFMLETIRQYAWERLRDAGEEEWLAARHARWFLEFAERAEQQIDGPEQSVWYARLEAEHDNLRAALRRGAQAEDPGDYMRLCAALAMFWYVRGHVSEGRRWLEGAATRGDRAPAPLRAKTLYRASILVLAQGDHVLGERLLGESLALFRELGDGRGALRALLEWAFLQQDRRDYDSAVVTCQEALALARELDDQPSVGTAGYYLGLVHLGQGDFDRAALRFGESLDAMRRAGNRRGEAAVLHSLGECAHRQGKLGEASERLEECMAIARELGDARLVADSLNVLGSIANDKGEHARALALHVEALDAHRNLEDRLGIAYALEGVACAAAAKGCADDALRLAGAAARLREALHSPPSPAEREAVERHIDAAREALGEERAQSLFETGRGLELEAAVAHAIECAAAAKDTG